MRYQMLGRSGLRASEIALGTVMMGLEASGRAGGNFFDSALIYNNGASERVLGEFVSTDCER